MKNRIITLSLREIKNSFKRFLSLLIISMLGVTVFVGIKATAPDMMNSIDKYYDENNIYDIKLVSANGLTDEDISMLKDIKDIQDVEGTLTYGFEAEDDDSTFVVNYHSISDNINKIQMESGRLPKASDEIVETEAWKPDYYKGQQWNYKGQQAYNCRNCPFGIICKEY